MTPEEILAGLRDIHLPAAETATLAGSQFSPWPLVFAIVLLCVIFLLRLRNRTSWRRRLGRDLAAYVAQPELQGIRGLIVLRNRVASRGYAIPHLPDACFAPTDTPDPAVLRQAAEDLRRLLAS